MPVNEYGQMIGEPVDNTPGVLPSLVRIEGRYTIKLYRWKSMQRIY